MKKTEINLRKFLPLPQESNPFETIFVLVLL